MTNKIRFAAALLVIGLAAICASAQAPTLRIQTDDPNLPSDLYYGNIKVKPLRLRPGTNQPVTIDDNDFMVQQQYIDFLSQFRLPFTGLLKKGGTVSRIAMAQGLQEQFSFSHDRLR